MGRLAKTKRLDFMRLKEIPDGMPKKTTSCTGEEIIGRIIKILNSEIDEVDMPSEIRELIEEWIHS